MTTLRVGIASYEEMKARTVARGGRRIAPGEKVWLTSTESFAKLALRRQSRSAARHRRKGARLARPALPKLC